MSAALLAVAVLAGLGTTAARGGQVANSGERSPFFVATFDDGTLLPWDNYDLGSGGTTTVASAPTGGASGGIVRVSDLASASGRHSVELTVTPEANVGSAPGHEGVHLWNNVSDHMGHDGQETWERFRVMFPRPIRRRGEPSRTSEPSFVPGAPCTEHCTWFVEHHNDDSGLRFFREGKITWELPPLVWGVTTRRISKSRSRLEMFMRIFAGDNNVPGLPPRSRPTYVYADARLKFNHWYQFKVRVKWSPDATGLVQWWLDGVLLASIRTPTLWRHPDGSVGAVNFQIDNYRPHRTTTSTMYFDDIRLGTTAAAVGG